MDEERVAPTMEPLLAPASDLSTSTRGGDRAEQRSSSAATGFAKLYAAAFSLASAYGLLLLMPLFVKEIGGTEFHVGAVLWGGAASALTLVGLTNRLAARLGASRLTAAAAVLYAAGTLPFVLSSDPSLAG